MEFQTAETPHDPVSAADPLVAGPSGRASTINVYMPGPVLNQAEPRQVHTAPAGTTIARPAVRNLAVLLEAQARRTPTGAAVLFGHLSITFAELHAQANRLAHHLRSLGVGPDTLVGIALERSPDLLVAVLAVLKAGGAYVPLDPAYPKDRLAFTLQDARAEVLITRAGLRATLPPAPVVVCLDTDAARIACQPDTDPDPVAGPSSLCYVIYTSGSTGKPKGVAVEHRSVIELVQWAADTFSANELAGVLFGTSICFDLSVYEMFVPLCLGGTVVLADNVLQLPDLPQRDRVTLVNTVPSAAAFLVSTNGLPASVRVVNLAGEPLPDHLAQAVYAIPTVRKLYNLYGPTEDTVYSTWSLVERGQRVHLGRPLPNTRAYILDPAGKLALPGEPGELHLAGAGLAREYLNRPDLTAERFVSDPFVPGRRMYKTGDLCRWRPDGNLDFLGRLDHQVKIRGFRIELGEVEAELCRQSGVRQAIVTAADDPAGGQRLVAYVVGDPAPPTARLRDGLRRALPEYMVPSSFVALAALPLTPNGKVDRNRLPAPDGPDVETPPGPVSGNETEQVLAAIWRDALGVPVVEPDDDFFDLGGHSLLAARVVARIEKALGQPLPLVELFRNPTVGQLATHLRGPGASSETPVLVSLQSGRGAPLFCVPGQGDYGAQFRDLSRQLPQQAVYAFSFERWERDPTLFQSLEEIATLFVAEMRRVQPAGPYRLAGLCFGGWVAFEMARQLRLAGETVSVALIETYGPVHSPVTSGSRGERVRQLWWHFRRLTITGKAGFICRRLVRIAGRLLPGRRPAAPSHELTEGLPGGRYSYLSGPYRARPIPGTLDVIRVTDQPDWYRRYGGDALDLGWGGFAAGGVRVSVVPGGRVDLLHEPALQQLATALRTAMESSATQ